ncbi:MAG: DNA polymerase III subunit gamma/tau, partial [Mycobacteriaceae bacterium]
ERIGPATLARYAEIIHTGLGDMRGATAPRLLLEVMCARMLLPSASDAESAVLQRLERVERRMTITPPTEEEPALAFKRPSPRPTLEPAPAAARPRAAEPAPAVVARPPAPVVPAPTVPATPVAPAPSAPAPAAAAPQALPEPEPQRTVVAGQPDAATVRTVWSEVRSAVRERSRTTEVMLSSATVRRLEGDTLVLSHDSEPLAKRLTESRNADVVREALRDVLGVNWNVVCEAGADRAEVHVAAHPAATPPPAPAMHRYTRPSGGGAPSSGSDEVPLPDGPTDPDDPGPGAMPEPEPVDEESMLAEAASGELGDLAGRRDPEEAALELLAAELGAKPLDAR